MSENVKEVKYVRLRYIPDDIIGSVTYKEECILIEHPLRVEIELFFEEGRQIISMQEYLPQNIIDLQEIEIPLSDVLFVTPVKKEYLEQYENIKDYFYNNEIKEKPKGSKESVSETAEKVVSILEAMQAKKDKSVH